MSGDVCHYTGLVIHPAQLLTNYAGHASAACAGASYEMQVSPAGL